SSFIYQYYISHLSEFEQYSTPTELATKFKNTDDAWKSLVAFALRDSIYLDKIPALDKENIEERIKAFIARFKWRTQGFYEVYNLYDPIFQKAKGIISTQ